jgi:hypothetical protein
LSGVKKVKLNGLRTNLLFVLAGIIVSGMSPAFAVDQFGWPRFNLNDGQEHCAGKAFAVRWYRNRTLLLLPLHILSPEAEYSHYVAPQDVSKEVRSVDVLDLQQQSVLASSSTSLLKTGCTVGQGTGDLSGDLMAFELSSSSRLTPFNMLGTLAPVAACRQIVILALSQPQALRVWCCKWMHLLRPSLQAVLLWSMRKTSWLA